MDQDDQRLIEHGFPCHQVGAETQREQSVGLQPPVNRLHVWWARRPLTPSRAAIVASLSPADTDPERFVRQSRLRSCPEFIPEYTKETLDGFIYARQVICPHCEGEVPLLNTFWLSKQAADPWGVRLITDGQARRGRVRFETYRLRDGRGPRGENPGQSTVSRGLGTCPHCAQAIVGDEIKRQARGESPHGRWQDRLYAVVAVRFEPKLDKHGQPQRYKSGAKKGEIKTRKVRFFRPPNQRDLEALAEAQHRLEANWAEWEAAGLIPMKEIPPGHRRDERDGLVNYGITHWRQMFTPRQLLGHLYLVEGLKRLKPEILGELGQEKGRAVATYLQFAIDKGLDYNSKQTRWEFTRGVVKGTFSRHDFSLKWTFGEMVFTGPNSGAAWGLSQILDAYKGIAALTARPRLSETVATEAKRPKLTILNGTAAHLPGVADASVDLVCMDPPYYTRRTPNPGLRSTRLETPGCVGSKRSLFRTNNSGYSSRSTTNYLASGEAVPGTPIQALQKPRFDVRRV